MIVEKVVCENCNEEVLAEAGAEIVSVIAGLGGKPKDFCCKSCAKEFITKVDLAKEKQGIIARYENMNQARMAAAAAGVDPSDPRVQLKISE